ncbi:MAG: hypothetical protein JWN86_909 [Planctomycetota bacterium]|nr:hypothetical protein [Planctomycetota bacterium]
MLKRLLNGPERITYNRLSEVCARRSAQIYAKVRLADVLPIGGSGLSEGLFEFALQAHYDFVITDLAQMPLFAVEFDGPGHSQPAQVGRDAKKNELSRRFNLPLLRILADDLHRSEWRLDRLTEVTERWFDGTATDSGERLAVADGPAIPPCAQGGNMTERPLCPVCGTAMVLKHGRYGPFLSCTHYPDCRGSRDLPRPSVLSAPQAGGMHGPTVRAFARPWLIAGIVLVSLVFVSLMVVIARLSTEGPRARDNSPITTGADDPATVRQRTVPDRDERRPASAGADDPATVRQRTFLNVLISRRGWDTTKRDSEIERVLGSNRRYSELRKREATKLITAWDDRGR